MGLFDNFSKISVPNKRIGDQLSHQEFNEIVNVLIGEGTQGILTYRMGVKEDITIGKNLKVFGTIATPSLTASKSISTSSLTVNNQLNSNGTATFNNNITANKKITVAGELNVSGRSIFNGASTFNTGVVFSANKVTFLKEGSDAVAIANGILNIHSNGALVVSGSATFNNNVTFQNILRANQGLTATTITASGNVTFNNNLTATSGNINLGTTTIQGNLTVNGNINNAAITDNGNDISAINAAIGTDTTSGTIRYRIKQLETSTGNLSSTVNGTISLSDLTERLGWSTSSGANQYKFKVGSSYYTLQGALNAIVEMFNNYSLTSHNHDAAYAAKTHNHDANYAASTHNHDAAYAAKTHTHAYATTNDIDTKITEHTNAYEHTAKS